MYKTISIKMRFDTTNKVEKWLQFKLLTNSMKAFKKCQYKTVKIRSFTLIV